MATLAFTDAFVWVNSVDLSSHVESVTLNYSAEMLDETAMGDTNRVNKAGLKNYSLDLNLHQDYAAGAVDATLFSLVGTTACWEVRAVNACSAATNPAFSFVGIVESYAPMGGSVGALLDSPVTVASAGTLARAEAS